MSLDKNTTISTIRENYKNVFPPPVLDLLIYLFSGGQADITQIGETYTITTSYTGKLNNERLPLWSTQSEGASYNAIVNVEVKVVSTYDNFQTSEEGLTSIGIYTYKGLAIGNPDGTTTTPGLSLISSVETEVNFFYFDFKKETDDNYPGDPNKLLLYAIRSNSAGDDDQIGNVQSNITLTINLVKNIT